MKSIYSRGLLILASILVWAQAAGTEYQPWLGNLFEFEWRDSLFYQNYSAISSGTKTERDSANDLFLNESLAFAFTDFELKGRYGVELELRAANTHRQRANIDQIKLTGRYVLMDDIIDDPFALSLGASFIQAFRHSVHDISSFHHGKAEGELFLSFGNEFPQKSIWGSRWWGIAGIGIADQGSPWVRLDAVYEKRWCELHEIRVFAHSLWGLGGERLHRAHFQGYGPVQHESIDVGLRYTYELEFFGSASLEYTYRLYARNFPLHTNCVMAQLLCTFGL